MFSDSEVSNSAEANSAMAFPFWLLVVIFQIDNPKSSAKLISSENIVDETEQFEQYDIARN